MKIRIQTHVTLNDRYIFLINKSAFYTNMKWITIFSNLNLSFEIKYLSWNNDITIFRVHKISGIWIRNLEAIKDGFDPCGSGSETLARPFFLHKVYNLT